VKNETKRVRLEKIIKMTFLLRELAHITYDICFRISKGDAKYKGDDFINAYNGLIRKVDHLLIKLEAIIHNKKNIDGVRLGEQIEENETIKLIDESINHLDLLLTHY
jgi:hypothetical protein